MVGGYSLSLHHKTAIYTIGYNLENTNIFTIPIGLPNSWEDAFLNLVTYLNVLCQSVLNLHEFYYYIS